MNENGPEAGEKPGKAGKLWAWVLSIITAVIIAVGSDLATGWADDLFKKHVASGPMGVLEVGFNRNGGDLKEGQEVSDPDACSRLCSVMKDCMAMTYVSHPNVAGGVCWLKSIVPDAARDGTMTSAVKLHRS